jgi:hypothetical protein
MDFSVQPGAWLNNVFENIGLMVIGGLQLIIIPIFLLLPGIEFELL